MAFRTGDSMQRSRDEDEYESLLAGESENTPFLQRPEDPTPQPRLSIGKLLALVCINGGLQVFFSTVMANLSPYLQKLGLSKAATAPIIICLPLSGAFVGPIAGALSDRLRTRWGRRRPIILGGAICTALFLLLLAWTEQIVRLVAACSGGSCGDSEATVRKAVVALAVIFTLLLSISVQPVQAGVRSLTVDVAPANEQNRAWSWAGRVQGLAAIFSFFASSLNLPALPGLGRLSQFEALSCLNFITLGSTVLTTCIVIGEKDSRNMSLQDEGKRDVFDIFKHIFQTTKQLPCKVGHTCRVQFFSWMAWFSLLYYNTTYVGELDGADMSARQDNGADQLAQAGSLASLSFAVVGFIFVTGLPVLLLMVSRRFRRAQQSSTEEGSELRDLVWLWVGTQPLLGMILVATLAAVYQWQGIVLVALAGVPWAVTQWVPFAIVGFEISRLGLTGVDGQDESADSKAGAILGLHNLAISLPQVLSGLISSGTYRIAEVAGSQVPTAWVMASSGLMAFVAALWALRMLHAIPP